MPKRDWLLVLAVGIAILFGAVVGLGIADYLNPTPWLAVNGSAASANAENQQSRRAKTPQESLTWIDATKGEGRKVPCAEGANSCQPGEDFHDALDLEAQWASALAGERMARLAVWQIVFGGLGIAAVAWSLKLNREATGSAAKAADAAMRTVETTAKGEQAYIFGGGPNRTVDDKGRPSTHQYMAIQNHGRTIGFITLVEWGLCPKNGFPENGRVSELIDKNLLPSVTINRVFEVADNILRPSEGNRTYRDVGFGDEAMGSVFFGRIRFKDIFGKCHYSTFKLLLNEGADGSTPLPGCYSEDWGQEGGDQKKQKPHSRFLRASGASDL